MVTHTYIQYKLDKPGYVIHFPKHRNGTKRISEHIHKVTLAGMIERAITHSHTHSRTHAHTHKSNIAIENTQRVKVPVTVTVTVKVKVKQDWSHP